MVADRSRRSVDDGGVDERLQLVAEVNVPDGVNWVMNTTARSSVGSTQKMVDAQPPHMKSPADPITAVRAGPETDRDA